MAPDRPPDPIAVALRVATIFEGLGIGYFAGGSLASQGAKLSAAAQR